MGTVDTISTFNPFISISELSKVFVGMVYDSLMSVGPDLEPVPNLATHWMMVPPDDPEMVSESRPYGSMWQYNLTTNATWSDGEPFTSDDVVFTLNLISSPDNYPNFWNYQAYSYYIENCTAVDGDTVRVRFYDRSTGDAIPVSFGGSLYIPIVPSHLLEYEAPSFLAFNWSGIYDSMDPPIVGTGPFVPSATLYDDWLAGAPLLLTANPEYHWEADYQKSIAIEGISITQYPSAYELESAIRAGEVDVCKLPMDNYAAVVEDVLSGDLSDVGTYAGLEPDQLFTKVAINMDDGGGSNLCRLDPAIRTAIAMSTDKTSIAETDYAGMADPGSTIISPVNEVWHYEPTLSEMIAFDPVAADELLNSSGYLYVDPYVIVRSATPDSLPVQMGWVPEYTYLTFDLLVRSDHPEEFDVAKRLQNQLTDIGIQLTIYVVDSSDLMHDAYMYSYDMLIWETRGDPDPQSILFCQSSKAWAGLSDNLYWNYSYEESYDASVTETSFGLRALAVDDCQRIFYEDVGYVVLAYPYQTYAWRTDRFTGWGDWDESPGMSLDAFWGANPLWFELASLAPNLPPAAPQMAYLPSKPEAGTEIWFNMTSSDEDNDNILFTVDFGDGNLSVNTSQRKDWTQYSWFYHSYAVNGTYQVTVWADDGTDLLDHNVSSMFSVIVGDQEAPYTTAHFSGTEGMEGWYVSSVNVTLTATDNWTYVASTWWTVGMGSFTRYLGEPITMLGQGMMYFQYYSIDNAGNVEETKALWVKIDKAGPVITPSIPLTGEVFESENVTLSWTAEDEDSGLETVYYTLDGGTPVDVGITTESVSLVGLSEGEHTFELTCTDEAGNTASVEVVFEVDLPGAYDWLIYVVGGVIVLLAAIIVALLLTRKKPSAPQ